MGNREVSIGISGAVLGVIIGAGALSFQNGIVVDASVLRTPVAFRTIAEDQIVRRRNVDAEVQPEVRHNLPTIVERSESSAAKEEAPKDPSTCTVVKRVVAEIAAAHNRAIADEVKNAEVRSILKKALDAVVAKHCDTAYSQQSSAAVTTTDVDEQEKTDNRCTRYSKFSLRYTQCKINEAQGKDYQGY